MPVMNSYSVVVVDQCVDANLLRIKVCFLGFLWWNSSTRCFFNNKDYRKGFLSVISLPGLQCSRPFSIYMIFAGSFIRFTRFLQAPLFDLHCIDRLLYLIYMKIYRLLYSIYMKIYRLLNVIYMIFTGSFIRFTGSFIRFTWYLQAPLFDLHENLQAP